MTREVFWRKALEESTIATQKGALIPLSTHLIKLTNLKQIDFEFRELLTTLPKYQYRNEDQSNPFKPWDKRLEISRINQTHVLILNKYPVQIGHMLLISNEFKKQSDWLTIADFEALREVEKDTSGLWFFNSSPLAGASQPHRHIQLLRRDPYQAICPRESWYKEHLNKLNDSNDPLSNSSAVLERIYYEEQSSANELYDHYLELASKLLIGSPINNKAPTLPYNLLISNKWIALIRRSREEIHGFNLNALGFAGYILITKNSNMKWLIANGPEKLLSELVEPI